MANVLGIDLTQLARALEGTDTVSRSSAQRTDPRATEFGRELYTSMVRTARAERNGRTEVVAARTPLSGSQAALAIQSAYSRLFGSPPSGGTLSVLVAQWAHETGGGASMLNYNFGGLKGASPSGLTTAYTTHEGSGAAAHKIVAHFRAYESAADGATDYLRLLSQRFPAAMDAAQRGDAAGFVHALKEAGYFTDSEVSYTRSVCALTERARTHGYDAVGRTLSGGSPTSPAVLAAHDPDHSARAGLLLEPQGVAAPQWGQLDSHEKTGVAHATPDGNRTVDLAAMNDELARAALRIAAGDPRNEES